ncbi:hypothetical protein ACFWP2_20565 [Kitasatospora sp. NPDC058444]|uniref:hypothetical protein n=1 Tax=Kitasatospora sp. NPDC058444 TaxID=3346504 RepID=UPI0036600837
MSIPSITWQCPEPHDGRPAPVYASHSSRSEFFADSVRRRACTHITPEERAELSAGRVPRRLAVVGVVDVDLCAAGEDTDRYGRDRRAGHDGPPRPITPRTR